MTAAAATAPAVQEKLAGRLFEPPRSTLEEEILGAWEDLRLAGRAACPVCAGELESGGCATCGSKLS